MSPSPRMMPPRPSTFVGFSAPSYTGVAMAPLVELTIALTILQSTQAYIFTGLYKGMIIFNTRMVSVEPTI